MGWSTSIPAAGGSGVAGGLLLLAVRTGEPGAGVCVFPGQRNWPGWWWFSCTAAHVGYESWVERDVLMALDADPDVEAVASQAGTLLRDRQARRAA